MTLRWTDHVLAVDGRAWSSVARLSSDGWSTQNIVCEAAQRSEFLCRIAAVHGWQRIPVPELPTRFELQLKILLATPVSVSVQRSIELILYEIYAVPTALIWDIEAS